MLVAGVDSSTQSTKVVLCRAEDGAVEAEFSAPHPDGTECHPRHWAHALDQGRDLLERAGAVAVAAQQHGMVATTETGEVVRPALLWNDTRSAPQARALVAELGGPNRWAELTGSVPLASFTVTKLRWMAEHEPENAERTAHVMLPHDWLTLELASGRLGSGRLAAGQMGTGGAGTGGRGSAEPVTDRGDASGTGYWSPSEGRYLPELLRMALGREPLLPRVAGPAEVAGESSWGAAIAPGTGDNMGAALGLGVEPGDLVVSIGTSGTAYTVTDSPAADPSGAVAGFADATGRFLPLVCTLNAARIISTTAELLGVDLGTFSRLALAAAPGAGGLTLLPYLEGERTPDRPGADGVLRGLTGTSATRENLARAAVEALLCSLADAADRLGVTPSRVLLIGGGARSEAVMRIAPTIFGAPVTVPEPAEYVALGAARQAAWALAGTATPPPWPRPAATTYDPEPRDAPATAELRARYTALRDATTPWHTPAPQPPI